MVSRKRRKLGLTRIFGGKRFRHLRNERTRGRANRGAEIQREKGLLARVVKGPKPEFAKQSWDIWVRRKRR